MNRQPCTDDYLRESSSVHAGSVAVRSDKKAGQGSSTPAPQQQTGGVVTPCRRSSRPFLAGGVHLSQQQLIFWRGRMPRRYPGTFVCGVAGRGDCIQKLDTGTPDPECGRKESQQRPGPDDSVLCSCWLGGLSGGRDLGTVCSYCCQRPAASGGSRNTTMRSS
jgi:hypothetical protein